MTCDRALRLFFFIRLNDSNLSSKSCQTLVSVLSTANCSLRELDLSNNDLCDEGVTLLSVGLANQRCRLDTLRSVTILRRVTFRDISAQE